MAFPQLHRWVPPCVSSLACLLQPSLNPHEQLGRNLIQLVRMSVWTHKSCPVTIPTSASDGMAAVRVQLWLSFLNGHIWFDEDSLIQRTVLNNMQEWNLYLAYFAYHSVFPHVETRVRVSYPGLNNIPVQATS